MEDVNFVRLSDANLDNSVLDNLTDDNERKAFIEETLSETLSSELSNVHLGQRASHFGSFDPDDGTCGYSSEQRRSVAAVLGGAGQEQVTESIYFEPALRERSALSSSLKLQECKE